MLRTKTSEIANELGMEAFWLNMGPTVLQWCLPADRRPSTWTRSSVCSWSVPGRHSLPRPGRAAEAISATAVVVGIGTVEYTPMAEHLGAGIYVATGYLLSCDSQ